MMKRKAQVTKDNLEQIIMHAPVPMVITDSRQDIILFNDKFTQTFGYTLEDISTTEQWWQQACPDRSYRQKVMHAWSKAAQLARHKEVEVEMQEWEFQAKDGSIRSVEFKMTVPGEISVITMNDVSDRKTTRQTVRYLTRVVESSPSSVLITNAAQVIEYVNPEFCKITGYSKDEVLGKTPHILKSGNTSTEVYSDLWETINSGRQWKGAFHNRKKNGELYWAHESVSAVENENGDITHFIAIQEPITQEFELKEQLSYQASHDFLTGLANRREFERVTERLLENARQEKNHHVLCFLSLDQFKVINDTCGHIAGDDLLRQLGLLLSDLVRRNDTLARLGGDEFGVLMGHCTLDEGKRVADAILKAIQEFQFIWQEQSFRIGVSIGLAAITEGTQNMTELLKQADAACYMAKDLGRNRIHVYLEEDMELAQRQGEMHWVTRINDALENDLFCLFAQPILALDSSNHRHYELLIRMTDRDGSIIPAGAFLTTAERYNFIEALDAWVIRTAFSLLAANPEFVREIEFISINLSGPSLTKGAFLEYISKQFRESGIAPDKICFEVTETIAISNLNAATSFISVLKTIGCRFALDDFGSGLSSFGYLKNLPVDYLKIDGIFVKDIVADPIDRAMVKSINEIGHVMGMKTVAEYVENDEIIDVLKNIGVDFAQGFGLGKPESFIDLLSNYNSQKNKPQTSHT